MVMLRPAKPLQASSILALVSKLNLDRTFLSRYTSYNKEIIMTVRAAPKSEGLKEPVRKFEDTFSAETVVLEKFFKNDK